jgi:hypothetical protein
MIVIIILKPDPDRECQLQLKKKRLKQYCLDQFFSSKKLTGFWLDHELTEIFNLVRLGQSFLYIFLNQTSQGPELSES